MKSVYRLLALLLTLCLLLTACAAPQQSDEPDKQSPTWSAGKPTPRATDAPQSFSADLTGEGGGQMFTPELLSFPDPGYGLWQAAKAGDGAIVSACSQAASDEGFILYRLDPATGALTRIPNSGLDRPFEALTASYNGTAAAISQKQDEQRILLLVAADNSVSRVTLNLESGILVRDLCLTKSSCLVCADAKLLTLDEEWFAAENAGAR